MKESARDKQKSGSRRSAEKDPKNLLRNLSSLSDTPLRVTIHGATVGSLAPTPEGALAFQYADSWIDQGFSTSPFSLPLEDTVFVAKPHPLDGVFGVFDDSMPDGWGRLLVDRTLQEYGIDPYSIGPLARLAIVGRSGMGALEYEPEIELVESSVLDDFDEVADACAQMLATDYSDDLDALFAMGGSSGGARPKILTSIDGEDWIVKFPSSYDSEGIGAQEYALACAAQACGIEMSEVRLLPSKRCSGYFAIKRSDRIHGHSGAVRKIHMASVGALLETSHRLPNLDYDMLMRLTLQLTDSMEEIERSYRLMTFNVLIGNRDDHAKNFTFLYDEQHASWVLSPAYDLTQNTGMNGKHATTVNGKGTDITREDILSVGERAGLSHQRAASVFDEIELVVHDALNAMR